jgi:hypothetical protein
MSGNHAFGTTDSTDGLKLSAFIRNIRGKRMPRHFGCDHAAPENPWLNLAE